MGGIIPCNYTNCQVISFVSAFQHLLKGLIAVKILTENGHFLHSQVLEEANAHEQGQARDTDNDQ